MTVYYSKSPEGPETEKEENEWSVSGKIQPEQEWQRSGICA
jgi:hypothetical protein